MNELVVFDLDGTLADASHRLHFIGQSPKDWKSFFLACGDDRPIEQIVSVYRSLSQAGVRIQIWTGRPEDYRAESLAWIVEYVDPYFSSEYLVMRAKGDFRNDDVVKPEFMEKTGIRPWLVFEDRDRVVRAWRNLGIKVCQVAEGAF